MTNSKTEESSRFRREPGTGPGRGAATAPRRPAPQRLPRPPRTPQEGQRPHLGRTRRGKIGVDYKQMYAMAQEGRRARPAEPCTP